MKKTLLLSIFSLFTFAMVSAQQLTVGDEIIEVTTADISSEIYQYTDLTNNTGLDLNLRWVRTFNEFPSGWINYFCTDPGTCGFPETDSLDFVLGPGATGELQVHFFPENTDGYAEVSVDLINTSNGNVLETVLIKITAGTVSVNELEAAQVSLFPNPADNFIQIQNGSIVDQIVIYNILGRQVKYFDTQDSNYYIGDLNKGIYLVKMIDEDSNSVKTLKLRKN